MKGRRTLGVAAALLVGLAVTAVAAWAGKPGFSSAPTSSTFTTSSSGAAALAPGSTTVSSSGVTGVGVLAVFSGRGFGAGDEVDITAEVAYLAACINGSGKYVAADVKKGPVSVVTGTLIITDSVLRRNGVVTAGQVYSQVVPWPPSGSAGEVISCPSGHTATWIGIEFSSITVSWFGSSGLIDQELAVPATQTWIDEPFRKNGS